MLVYQGTKASFAEDVIDNRIADRIRDCVLEKMGRHTPNAEYQSWANSMQFMNNALSDRDIPDNCGVAIEYNLPQTSKRVDFMLSGYDEAHTGQVNIVELKQWSEAQAVSGKQSIVKTYVGGHFGEHAHPSYQAWSYAETIFDYNEAVRHQAINLRPCSYLHNYTVEANDPLLGEQYTECLQHAPMFGKHDAKALRAFLKDGIVEGDDQEVLEQIDNGKIKPSKSLQDALAKMLKGSREFILLDDQKVVFEQAMLMARQCKEDGEKRVLIVEGGPGTGKSVVAINLLVALTGEGQVVQYVTRNQAPRQVYEQKLRGEHVKNISMMFKGSGQYVDALPDSVDVLVVDEAHRLNEKSGMFRNKGENQVKEIINAAKLSVFFIDESQRVTIHDIGSVKMIEDYALKAGAQIVNGELASQFRCNGSDGYLAWIDDVLEIRETANYNLEGIAYDFQVLDSPAQVERMVRERNQGNKARMLAGYCWDWPKEGRADTSYHDIRIGDWGISWNLDGGEPFAIGEDSVNEAGCIHTSQGLEFDYVGVIIGDDMRYEGGRVVCDYTKRAKTDQSLRGIKTMAKKDPQAAEELADEIIKNTYRTLMTRGMKGCYVYCTDKALAEHLKARAKKDYRAVSYVWVRG